MHIFYTIYHLFLVTHFPRVRRRLLGVSVVVTPALAAEVILKPLPVVFADAPEAVVKPAAKVEPKLILPRLPKLHLQWPELSLSKVARVWALNGVIALAILIVGFIFLPDIYYGLMPPDTQPVLASETGTPRGGSFERTQAQLETPEPSPTPRPLPPKDETLPEGDWIIIPRIGVRTQLQATIDADEALDTGVWMAPEYGRPGSTDTPLIAAAHRFGWQWWWKDDYWKYHSFNLLPELQPGDIVETISDQRKYYYEIYAGEEDDEITDYMADMILYTCKFLNSPVRHFRYARLVDMDKNTQASAVQ